MSCDCIWDSLNKSDSCNSIDVLVNLLLGDEATSESKSQRPAGSLEYWVASSVGRDCEREQGCACPGESHIQIRRDE